MLKNQKCFCPHCETELQKGCLSPEFCKPCNAKKNKICSVCKSEYAVEYTECPTCAITKK